MDTEERLAVFLDYDNLALGAREHLGGMAFDFGPIADALAARGRVVVRRAYADWSYFDEDRRKLTRHQVDLIEMPQRMGASRKNAADIKMVVDAIEMAFERDYISTFVMCTGDSDFSPLVHKLRELNKRVIGIGVENSTSRLLPSACDEFLFYDRLEGVDVPDEPAERSLRAAPKRGTGRTRKPKAAADGAAADVSSAEDATPEGQTATGADADSATDSATGSATKTSKAPARSSRRRRGSDQPAPGPEQTETTDDALDLDDDEAADSDESTLEVKVAQTLAGLQSSSSGAVTASVLKRTLLRKDPTFSESDYGFGSFGEFVTYLAERKIIEVAPGPSSGDPQVSLPAQGNAEVAFGVLRSVVVESGGTCALSGLKNRLRKASPAFSEKALGFRGFLQFCKAADAAGVVDLRWDDEADDYLVTAA